MTYRSLASQFNDCAQTLREGRATEAMQILRGIDARSLLPASAALHAHLSALAAIAARTSPSTEARTPATVAPPSTAEVVRFVINGPSTLLALDQAPPLPGVSLVSTCMNRQQNLLKVLPSWLASEADEIIIVDWSSTEPLWPMLAHIEDPRLNVVRIDDEPRWVLTHAFNVGLRLARHEVVFKLDADIWLAPGFLSRNRFAAGEFVRGFWKRAVDAGEPDQRYTNGSFGAFKTDLRTIGYYNERILTYGWDDSDLYSRLSGSLGRAGRLLMHDSLRHLLQEEGQRLENQAVSKAQVLGRFAPTEHENLVNKYHELISLEWGPYSPAQDYRIEPQGDRQLQGVRTSAVAEPRLEERDIARALAMRQLTSWLDTDLLPSSARRAGGSLEFGRLLKQAHEAGFGSRLIDALRTRQGIHFLSAESGALRHSAEKTVDALWVHRPEVADVILILADEGFRPGAAPTPPPGYLRASPEIIRVLAEMTQATQRDDLQSLESAITAGKAAGCFHWTVDFTTVARSAIAHSQAVASKLNQRYRKPTAPAAGTAFVTSVYDEANLLRLLEYLACIVLNLRAVEHLLLLYEARNGLFQLAAQALCRQLEMAPNRLAMLPFDRRPTFEQLFSLQSLLPAGTLMVVGNADVAVDASINDLSMAARDDYVYVLSRWDIDQSGGGAHLIRLENGVPNTFSADAWIARTPFTPDFRLDYEIGSFHCDSYINNQLSRSARYRWANPCLDVHVFHLHDARFNSSAEKHVRDRAEIQQSYESERQRNEGQEPLKGMPWCHLNHATQSGPARHLIIWRPKCFVLDMTRTGLDLASLLWLHAILPLAQQDQHLGVVIRMRFQNSRGAAGKLLALYKLHFDLAGLMLENEDAEFNVADAPTPDVMVRTLDATKLLNGDDSVGENLLDYALRQFAAFPANSPGVRLWRCELKISLGTMETMRLAYEQRKNRPIDYARLLAFIDGLDRWSDEWRLMQPFLADLRDPAPVAPALIRLGAPSVSFVTSLFRGDDFLPGYLENVASAAIGADGQVVLIDANCDDHDAPALERFFADRPELRQLFDIVRLDRDPGLYACWQLAIERARGEFISNANIDDRRSPQHTRRLMQALQAQPRLAGAAGSISAVNNHAEGGWFELIANQVWFHDLGEREFGFDDLFARNPEGSVRSHNIMHCMPVWRRGLHERYGFFDEERYGTSADWAFWLQCAKQGERFWLDPEAFGRYFVNPNSHNRRNDTHGIKERRIIADLLDIEQDSVLKQ